MQDLLVAQGGKNPNAWMQGAAPDASGEATPDKPSRSRRILIIEDDLDTARSFAYLLATSGHKVEYAVNGYLAWRVAQVFVPEVVILDLKLPDSHGADLVKKFRAHPELKNAYIISVTGSTDERDRGRAIAAGCDELLTKPIRVS